MEHHARKGGFRYKLPVAPKQRQRVHQPAQLLQNGVEDQWVKECKKTKVPPPEQERVKAQLKHKIVRPSRVLQANFIKIIEIRQFYAIFCRDSESRPLPRLLGPE